ncbi:fatty acid-binding protein DegV, partial [Coprococcus eutactus]|nr:fatty acid-binding protein DegV [Coprococcus eutactus]
GRIELRDKFRGMKKTYDKLIDTLRQTGFGVRELVISDSMNEEGAEKLGHLIEAEWLDSDVSVVPASGLCSY